MSEMLKKMGLLGIGVISLTKEKVEELAQEMIKKNPRKKNKSKNIRIK
jgi:polyhydroxyalkanoate synthesis regulator phasin